MSRGGLQDALNRIYNLESPSRLKAFEGLRAWAVIMVFNVHFFAQYYQQHYFVQAGSVAEGAIKVLHAGHIGVDLFFVLSGFLIFSTLNRNKPTFRNYIGHRISRVMPAHIAVLFLLLFPAIPWGGFLSNIFFLPTFFPWIENYNIVTWTLGWEWFFYVLMFGIFNSNRGLYVGMLSTIIVLFVVTYFFGEAYRWGELVRLGRMPALFPEPGRFAGFFIGVVVAHLLTIEKRKLVVQSAVRALLPIAIVGVLISQVMWSIYAPIIGGSYVLCNLFYLTASTCFGVIVAYLATSTSGGVLNQVCQSTFMRIIGQISFSFYLIHALVTLPMTARIVGNVNSFSEMCLNYICGFLLTVILATMTFYYFERPYFRSIKN